jgi:hypothetical protein
MTRVPAPGANGDVDFPLFLRQAGKLGGIAPGNAQVVPGDVLKQERLNQAIAGQDLVYANLAGDDIDRQAKNIVEAMNAAGIPRLLFVASLGIYDEVPGRFGRWNRRQIGPYLRFQTAQVSPEARCRELMRSHQTPLSVIRRRPGRGVL